MLILFVTNLKGNSVEGILYKILKAISSFSSLNS